IVQIAKEQISERGWLHKVNIEDASSYPLPIIISKCNIHISGSSGSILEAAAMGIPSLILYTSGGIYYKDLLESKEAFLVESKSAQDLLDNIKIHGLS